MPLQTAPYLLYYLSKVWKAQRFTLSELEELQNKRLRAIVKHAYERVPYYQDDYEKAIEEFRQNRKKFLPGEF